MEDPNCPECGSTNWELQSRKGGYQWKWCPECNKYFALTDAEREARIAYVKIHGDGFG